MRGARLRSGGWQAVLPWKALRGVGVRVALGIGQRQR